MAKSVEVNEMSKSDRAFVEWLMGRWGANIISSPHRLPRNHKDYIKGLKRGCDSCKSYDPRGNHTGYKGIDATCDCDWWAYDWKQIEEFLKTARGLEIIHSKMNPIVSDMVWLGTKGC